MAVAPWWTLAKELRNEVFGVRRELSCLAEHGQEAEAQPGIVAASTASPEDPEGKAQLRCVILKQSHWATVNTPHHAARSD